ncbi:PepSY domain-containing protein [Sphingomonas sp.]|uniref:PepSY domain-containing protein n=1 Tax=Sphingomonas sp. TaxID=28214 RepID=UPI002DD63CD6|nr:PepSY domain-containing protein [Sphingomonas sp.]
MSLSITRVAAIATGSLLLAGTAPVDSATAQPRASAAPSMSFATLEQKAIGMGIRPTELKIGRRVAEIEGRDGQGREVEVKLDPRSGQVLSRKFDD